MVALREGAILCWGAYYVALGGHPAVFMQIKKRLVLFMVLCAVRPLFMRARTEYIYTADIEMKFHNLALGLTRF